MVMLSSVIPAAVCQLTAEEEFAIKLEHLPRTGICLMGATMSNHRARQISRSGSLLVLTGQIKRAIEDISHVRRHCIGKRYNDSFDPAIPIVNGKLDIWAIDEVG
jgi:hypothetical protein